MLKALKPKDHAMVSRLLCGKFRVQQEIARGGMGILYLALDEKLNRPVAIKLLHAHLSSDASFANRFLREARAMARLGHEHIVRVHSVEEIDGSYGIVMEYFPGLDLRGLLKRSPCLAVSQTLAISLQISRALAYAHTEGIIHRDIKPANILMGKADKVKLTDFGIAAALDDASLTLTGQVIGTPEYMSPEQARGARLDGRSDLYSMGILMYEMLTGHTPFHEASKTSILGKLAYEESELSLSFSAHVPGVLQGVIRDLTKRKAQDRPADAHALSRQLQELQVILGGEATVLVVMEENAPTIVVSREKSREPPATRVPNAEPPSTPTENAPASDETIAPSAPAPSDETRVGNPHIKVPDPSIILPETPPGHLAGRHWRIALAGLVIVTLVSATGYYVMAHRSQGPSSEQAAFPSAPPQQAEKPETPSPQDSAIKEFEWRYPTEKKTGTLDPQVEEQHKLLATDQARLEKKPKIAATQRTHEKGLPQVRHQPHGKSEDGARRDRQRPQPQRRDEEDRKNKEHAAQRALEDDAFRQKAPEDTAGLEQQGKAEEARRLKDEADQRHADAERQLQEKELAAHRAREEEARRRTDEKAAQREAEETARRERDKQAGERQARLDSKPLANDPSNAPKDLQVTKAFPDAQLQTLLDAFERAYEGHDLEQLQSLAPMSVGRRRNVEFMFDNYDTIKGSMKHVSPTEQGALVVFMLETLVKRNGEPVEPSTLGLSRTIRLQVLRQGQDWGKIVW